MERHTDIDTCRLSKRIKQNIKYYLDETKLIFFLVVGNILCSWGKNESCAEYNYATTLFKLVQYREGAILRLLLSYF